MWDDHSKKFPKSPQSKQKPYIKDGNYLVNILLDYVDLAIDESPKGGFKIIV